MKRLLPWYERYGRDLPWRRTRDPYAIWVSEAMCQQTQVGAVIPYYERWMARFPTAASLAAADLDEVLALWQGLGYYRRARFLHAGASQALPTDYAGWRAMPGVGAYTAAAIASICFNEPKAVVDGNVERVFARFTGCFEVGPRLTKLAQIWADSLLDPDRPGDSNQAAMELGAKVCKPRNPLCSECPLTCDCVAFREGLVNQLPKPKPRPATERLEWSCVVPVQDGRYGMVRVPAGGWWEGMYAFPEGSQGTAIGVVTFTVTKHRIRMSGYLAEGPRDDVEWFTAAQVESLSLPAPYRRMFELATSSQTSTGR